ncbi:BA14K family protein [Allorhizobium undicola]|uniref:BA14K family protein n=1 Tax=Allorhizobium undicola TaxID=78527 RepID=UPI003D33BA6F
MTKIKAFAVAVTGIAVLATSVSAAGAMPLSPYAAAGVADQPGLVQQVQWRDDGYYRRPPPPPGYYGGYRGYREFRPGYRRHRDGYWYPLAAFAAGAIIGGAIASQPRPAPPPPSYGGGINPRHYEWCQMRYRSYDSYSNTFVNYDGMRQQCYSPYY